MSNIFGWSYPPGVTSDGYDKFYPCHVCGNFDTDCICPDCPICGEYGNPRCYPAHLALTQAQRDSKWKHEQEMEALRHAETAYLTEEYSFTHTIAQEMAHDATRTHGT